MAVVDSQVSLWEALAGRAPGRPVGPADPGLWTAVAERINPAKARPVLRAGVEMVELVSARGVPYVMLRSPDRRNPCYVRLTPDEARLTHLMDGTRTVARLVADFTRLTGRLAPDQVRRVVADLAGNRMLAELPIDAFAALQRVHRRPWPLRLGRALLLIAQGRRMVVANIDPLVSALYRAGGKLLFTKVAAVLMGVVAMLGLLAFGYQWWAGDQPVFLASDSYVQGALLLLGLNVFALACHEAGHALATKHAGRRVPNAGFLVYFGIPSVFVDTTDVWMAGRRARLLATAAGPATGLVLAGAASLIGLAAPAAAPICFKLAFAWYLNALFNLNPFLALDGYYLLMDWLEIPNLRARGLAWVSAQIRRRPPSWSGLDREGRLVALYGLLAVGWLIVALNIGYRLYVDRVGGLVTGLWRSGWGARVLLAAVILALASPIAYILAGWLRRGLVRLVRRIQERGVERDQPRRLAALRNSALRDLPEAALQELAAQARWRHPRPGEQVITAGAAQPYVFAVIDGALEARRPGDPAGTVRERVGAGGVVGLAAALAGSAGGLHWYTAGTTLLAIPSTTVAAVLGPSGGAVPGDEWGTASEAEQLFSEAPGLSTLSAEDRMGLARVAVPISLAPRAPVTLDSGDTALVVASGIVATPDGQGLGRGTMIGPVGGEFSGLVATARTTVRLFSIPAVSGVALLLGSTAGALAADAAGRSPGRAPVTGVHPPAAYPPLTPPPGAPPPTDDDSADRRFEKRLWWLLILVVLLALLFTAGNVAMAAKPWSEMPSDKALLQVEVGQAAAVVNGITHDLAAGDDIYVGESDLVTVGPNSRALLTFRGGASAFVCAGTEVRMGELSSRDQRTGATIGPERDRIAPTAAVDLRRGRTVIDTASTSPSFADISLTVRAGGASIRNDGAARFAVQPAGTVVAEGTVFVGPTRQREVGGELDCGDGVTAAPEPSPTGRPTPSGPPSATPSNSASPTPSASASTTQASDPDGPNIRWLVDPNRQTVAQRLGTGDACSDHAFTVNLAVVDNGYGGPNRATHVVFRSDGLGYYHDQTEGGPEWYSTTPFINYPHQAGAYTIQVTAFDAQGDASATLQTTITVAECEAPAFPPVIDSVTVNPTAISPAQCGGTTSTLTVKARGSVEADLSAQFTYTVPGRGSSSGEMVRTDATTFTAVIGPIDYDPRETVQIAIEVFVLDGRNFPNEPARGPATLSLNACPIIIR